MSDGNGSPGHGAGSYEQKFAGFIEACRKAKEQGLTTVLVHHPHVLGDTYEELVESLPCLVEFCYLHRFNRTGADPICILLSFTITGSDVSLRRAASPSPRCSASSGRRILGRIHVA